MAAYYNEVDPFAAAWLRELIVDGHIAPGEVDERSIEDVAPDDLRPFRQCHFFAGIGVWSLAARLAGIPDDAPLWTGSCPCGPFSGAGKRGGFADERHLWPAFHYLIEQCAPAVVAGEQVAGDLGDAWLDLVQADMDATGYAFGAVETCAAGFGAPQERSRNYWVAVSNLAGPQGLPDGWTARPRGEGGTTQRGGAPDRLVHAHGCREGEVSGGDSEAGGHKITNGRPEDGPVVPNGTSAVDGLDDPQRDGWGPGRRHGDHGGHDGNQPHAAGAVLRVADAHGGLQPRGEPRGGAAGPPTERRQGAEAPAGRGGDRRPGPTNGWWRVADWLLCRDERWRPVEPGTFPLADAGTFRNRVGLLRGAGNAVTIGQAQAFLEAVVGSLT